MDNQDQNTTSLQSDTNLSFTETAKRFLSEAGKWGKFISIVGFVAVGILAIFGLFAGVFFSNLPGYEELPFPSAFFSVVYIGIAALYFFPILYLYRFSAKIRHALNLNDQAILEYALQNLKSHYKFIAILMIVMLGIYALALVFAIIAGAMSML